jgi:pSer/pThr/pTyr-binding forkhead associated (FHA) protein
MPYRLRYLAHDLELPIGEFVVGRSTECQLSLDDPLVSRRHAVLRVRRDGVSVQDFGSRNGVLVNGTKISGERELTVGDKVGIGSQEMVLQAAEASAPNASSGGEEVYRRATQTLGAAYVMDLRNAVAELAAKDPSIRAVSAAAASGPTPRAPEPAGHRPPTPAAGAPPPAAPSQPRSAPTVQPASVAEATPEGSRAVQSFQLLGGVADKSLAMGKADDAERYLQTLLNDVLNRAREGQAIEPGITEPAARYAARLAGATGKAAWVDYVFELYRRQRRVLPAPIVDELYSVVRKIKALDLGGIRAYLETLREGAATFGPADRFLMQRIEGLERQMALK